MLDKIYFNEKISELEEALKKRNFDASIIEDIKQKSNLRKKAIKEVEELKAIRNKASQEIAQMKQKGEDASVKISEMKVLGEKIKELESQAKIADEDFEKLALILPNIPDATVPVGKDETQNKEIKKVGEIRKFNFQIKDHVEIAEKLNILDLDRAAKVTGSRFAFLRGFGAKLERALINFMLDIAINEHGYEEWWTPYIVNRATLTGTGQLPKFEEDLFKIPSKEDSEKDLFLIPTAEVPLTNLFRDEILDGNKLPLSITAYTPCFRSEAGSYGKDVRGLIRQHQFDKVELVKIVHPEKSEEEHEKLTRHAETVLERLELPYRRVVLCSGDMGFAASKCYDLEVWLPSANKYREISSCSNFKDFQARRANIRFRYSANDKPQFVHTINGSGLAVGRTWLAILENYQQEDGSVLVPKALQPYIGVEVLKVFN
jgi:seryl-tRNA synthetase